MWDASQCMLNTCAKVKKTWHQSSLNNWERWCCPHKCTCVRVEGFGDTKTGGLSEVICKQRRAVLSTILYDKQWWLSKQHTEKAVATHSSPLAWRPPWTEEPGRLQPMGFRRVGHAWVTSLSCIWEANGNPLQHSCLENPRDGGAW